MEKMDEDFADASVSGFQHLIPHHGGNGRGCSSAGGGPVRGGGRHRHSHGQRRPPFMSHPHFETAAKTAARRLLLQWRRGPPLLATLLLAQPAGPPHLTLA